MPPIVFFSFPAEGHINPTLPVVGKLASQGEEVFYFATARFRAAVEASGVRFVPYPQILEIAQEGPGPFGRITTTLETLLRMSDAVLDDQLEQVRAIGPAVLVHDSFSPWGKFVAERLRLPAVSSVPSILVNREIVASYPAHPESERGLTRDWFRSMDRDCGAFARRHGVTKLAPSEWLQVYEDLNIVYTSRLFQPRAELFDAQRFRFVGASIGPRADAPSFPFHRLGSEPIAYISLGTVYCDRARFFPMCFQAFQNSPWRIVLAVGPAFPLSEPAPENCIVVPYAPQLEILQRAAVFVTHGGMNSVSEALYSNVPLVLAPQSADQFWISGRVAELGAGVLLADDDIRESVERVLEDRRYSVRAAAIGESLRAAGGSEKAASEIIDFRRARRPRE